MFYVLAQNSTFILYTRLLKEMCLSGFRKMPKNASKLKATLKYETQNVLGCHFQGEKGKKRF